MPLPVWSQLLPVSVLFKYSHCTVLSVNESENYASFDEKCWCLSLCEAQQVTNLSLAHNIDPRPCVAVHQGRN